MFFGYESLGRLPRTSDIGRYCSCMKGLHSLDCVAMQSVDEKWIDLESKYAFSKCKQLSLCLQFGLFYKFRSKDFFTYLIWFFFIVPDQFLFLWKIRLEHCTNSLSQNCNEMNLKVDHLV